MKKKHIQYRSGLLIGLLSLSTLSSCVHTRPELGMGPFNSKHSKNTNVEEGHSNDSSKNSSTWKNTAYGLGGAAVGAAAGAAVGYFSGSSNSSCPNGSSNFSSGSNATTGWSVSNNAWGSK